MSESKPTVCRHGALRRSCETCDLAEDVERLERERDALREALRKYGLRSHYYCDDSWYSCPKAEGGCLDERQGTECNCGADKHNAEVRALIGGGKQ